jgi:hypothetical protein
MVVTSEDLISDTTLRQIFTVLSNIEKRLEDRVGPISEDGPRTNYAPNTEDLTSSLYNKVNVSFGSGIAGPYPGTNAQRVLETATSGNHYISCDINAIGVVKQGINLTISARLKRIDAGNRSWVRFGFSTYDGNNPAAYFDLANGVVGSTRAETLAASIHQEEGFWVISVTGNMGFGNLNPQMIIFLASAEGVVSYAGDTSKGVFLFGINFIPTNGVSSYIASRAKPVTVAGNKTMLWSAITATSPAVGEDLRLAGLPSGLGTSGVLTLEREDITFKNRRYGTVTVVERGANGTLPAAHAANLFVEIGATLHRLSRVALELLVGSNANPGLGVDNYSIIESMANSFNTLSQNTFDFDALRLLFTREYFAAIENNIQAYAEKLLTGTPSYGDIPIIDLDSFLRYRNDKTTGTPYTVLVPHRVARQYWIHRGGNPLNGKVVVPPATVLATAVITGAATSTNTLHAGLNRYSVNNSENYTQGFVAQNLRARVTVASSGTVAIEVTGEGQSANGDYFGRAANGGDDGTTADPSTTLHSFSGVLDMSAVGNIATLAPATTGDRCLKISTLAVSGSATSGTFVVETVPDLEAILA